VEEMPAEQVVDALATKCTGEVYVPLLTGELTDTVANAQFVNSKSRTGKRFMLLENSKQASTYPQPEKQNS
jgi:hypothetical protein